VSDTEVARTIGGVEVPPPGVWEFDPAHSSITIIARHMVVTKVRGHLGPLSGTIHIADKPEDSWVEVVVDSASVDTRNETRDQHLRSPDFLHVEKFPTISFRSTKVEPVGGPALRVTGDLTIRGVTRPLVLNGEFLGVAKNPWGKTIAAFTASGEIDREEFGMVWNQALETGGFLVSKKFQIEAEVQASLKTDEQGDTEASK
jgi:polyisoprenoid-binding protein YceI